jgi:hypothetical protein
MLDVPWKRFEPQMFRMTLAGGGEEFAAVVVIVSVPVAPVIQGG